MSRDSDSHLESARRAFAHADHEAAVAHFRAVIAQRPADLSAHVGLAQCLLHLGDVEQALETSARAVELHPENPDALLARAWALDAARRPEQAAPIVRRLLDADLATPQFAMLYAQLARHMREEEQAIAFLDRMLANPAFPPDARAALHHAAAELLDRLGWYDEAFARAAAAHELMKRPYDPRRHSQLVETAIGYFTRQRLQALPKSRDRRGAPVFIVGMPRSGTSLIEQILSSHPQVHAGGELNWMGGIMAALRQSLPGAFPQSLNGLTPDLADQLAALYLDRACRAAGQAAIHTDKMPLNFLSLGLLSLILPHTKVIHCLRDPRDTCLSCYLTSLQPGIVFTHDQGHLAAFYRDYRRLIDHWKQVIELPILDVQYESVVEDIEGQTRRLLEFLGLPWDERCLRFHENSRLVRTASQGQVRSPLYRSSVGRWRNYEKHIGGLLGAGLSDIAPAGSAGNKA